MSGTEKGDRRLRVASSHRHWLLLSTGIMRTQEIHTDDLSTCHRTNSELPEYRLIKHPPHRESAKDRPIRPQNGLAKDQGRRNALHVAISRSARRTVPLRESPATRPTRSTGSRATTPPGRVSRSSSPRSLPSEMGRLPPSGRRAVPEILWYCCSSAREMRRAFRPTLISVSHAPPTFAGTIHR